MRASSSFTNKNTKPPLLPSAVKELIQNPTPFLLSNFLSMKRIRPIRKTKDSSPPTTFLKNPSRKRSFSKSETS
jgi:hypothetical protein